MCSVINAILQIARRRNCKSARRRGAPRAAGAVAIHIFLEASFHRPAVVDQKRSGTTRSLISHQKGMKMSGIVLSASVRQNLLSLQSTAELLSTTQSRLATGNKVNSALDNPTNFFTAQGLNNRASDINNLLDSIGNGVQVLQAANTGITSLQKLVDSSKSIASQVLQANVGYTPRSNVSSAPIPGATPTNLLGTGTNATVTGAAIPGATATTTKLSALTTAITTSDSLTIDGKTISFNNSGGGNAITSAGGSLDLTPATVGDLLAAVDTLTG